MTSSEILKKETDEIIQRTGIHIPPYRLANLMKTAQRVLDMIVKSDICVSYHEALLVLRIVSGAINEVTGGETEK